MVLRQPDSESRIYDFIKVKLPQLPLVYPFAGGNGGVSIARKRVAISFWGLDFDYGTAKDVAHGARKSRNDILFFYPPPYAQVFTLFHDERKHNNSILKCDKICEYSAA